MYVKPHQGGRDLACIDNGLDRSTLLSRWRQITGSLAGSTYGHIHVTPDDPRLFNIERIANDLDYLLKPLASRKLDDERRRNMVEILKRGANFGYMLLTQATGWEFDWAPGEGDSSTRVVVFPALVQTVDDQGQQRRAPIRMSGTEESVLVG
jgi:hypothetical protein